MQTITVCTDAGHKNFHKQSVAVWATYIRTPSQTIHSSGIINQHTKGSSHAELYAIANALHILGKRYDLSKYKLILYADNLYALQNHKDGTLKNPKPDHKEVYDKWIKPHLDKAMDFEARHVKGHLPKSQLGANPARYFMQDWCDQEVHRMMKVALEIVKQKVKKALVFSEK